MCVDLTLSSFPCGLICICRKPGSNEIDVEYISDCIKCFKKLCSTEKLVIITGDCNLPDIDWSCYHAPNSAIYNTFIDFVNNFGFLWSPYGIGQTIYIFMLWFILSSFFFFPRLISAAADWMSAILPHMVWP